MIKQIMMAAVIMAISGQVFADDNHITFVANVPNGLNQIGTVYKDKTYNFSCCYDTTCQSKTSIGSVRELADGSITQTEFPLNADHYPVWIAVDVSDGVSTTKLADVKQSNFEGSYISTASYYPSADNKVTVTFDPVSAPTGWRYLAAS